MKYKDSFNQCKHNSTACETRPPHDGWLSWLARNCGAAPFKYIIDSVWSVQWAEPTQGPAWGQECRALFRGSRRPCRTPAWETLGLPVGLTALRAGCGWASSCWAQLRTPEAGLDCLYFWKRAPWAGFTHAQVYSPGDSGSGGTRILSAHSASRTLLRLWFFLMHSAFITD